LAVVLGPTISPAEKSAENPANQWSHERVSEFVVTHNAHCFLFTQKAMRCLEMSGTDQYLFVRGCLDIAKPVGIAGQNRSSPQLPGLPLCTPSLPGPFDGGRRCAGRYALAARNVFRTAGPGANDRDRPAHEADAAIHSCSGSCSC
jgi:hypothetical protein